MAHLKTLSLTVSGGQRTKDQIRAVYQTAVHPETSPMFDYLRESLEACRKRNDRLLGDALAWNQGACQVLQEILDLPQTAKDILKNN